MAPRDATKTTIKANVIAKKSIVKSLPANVKKTIEKKPIKMGDSATISSVQQQNSAISPKRSSPRLKNLTPKKVTTPKTKENKPVLPPSSVTKSGKKSWQRRPKPAHSGVPVPEKMKKLLEKQFLIDFDNSF